METKSTQPQSQELSELKDKLIKTIRDDKERRDAPFGFFRGVPLMEYTEASRAQFIGHRAKPDYKEDYQYNVFDPVTRDKVYAIISKTSGYYEAQFFNLNKRVSQVSKTITMFLTALYKDSVHRLKDKEKNKLIMLAALTTPKAIIFEGWRMRKRKIKEILERDKKTGEILKVKPNELVYSNDPYSELIPVEDFIPGSMKIRDIQEQPRLTWAPRMQEEQFKREFPIKIYPEADKVKVSGELINEGISEFSVRDDLKENEVEVIRYFNKWEDEYHIIANNILLTKPGNPIPFDHKEYPFVWGGFEELNEHFVYDLPLPIKLMDMQDVNNEVLNLTLDMLWRALNEVLLVSNKDEINEDQLYAGGIIDVDNPTNIQKLQFGSGLAFSASENLLNRIKKSLESSSVDAILAGQIGDRSNVTAREVIVAREAALEIASLFLENMENMERDRAYLRVKNMLDRYQRPVDFQKRVGDKLLKQALPVFRSFSVKNMMLENGKKGVLNVNITNKPRPPEELNSENLTIQEMSQTIDISPEFIRDIDFEVEVVANSSVKRSKALETQQAEAFLGNALKIPQILNIRKAAEDYIESLDKNPDENLMPETVGPDITGAFQEMGADKTKVPELGVK